MNTNLKFIWICPICHRQSSKSVRSHSLARRYGTAHLRIQHGQEGRDADIIIKKIDIRVKKRKKVMRKKVPSPKNQFWVEIKHLPAFNIQPRDKLMIPNHIFVSQQIYKKIQKEA